MITVKDFPDKQFATKEELFTALRENVGKIIAVKKAEVQKSYQKIDFNLSWLSKDIAATKGEYDLKDGYTYPVINTTKVMDSHKDVHFDGIWTKSIKEQQGKLFYITDHEMKVESVIAWPEDVKASVKTVPWSFVGKDYSGFTEALIFEIDKEKIVNAGALKIINEKRPVQNSVRMMYVKINLGMNSNAKEDAAYKSYYDARISDIANKDDVEADGYFWGVEEAKIITEGSMVLRGSNPITPIKQAEAVVIDTLGKTEPGNHSQKTSIFSQFQLTTNGKITSKD
jgi:hypothetical protein